MYSVFKIGPLEFPAYFTLLMIGYTIVTYICHKEAIKNGLDGNKILDLSLILLVAGVIGARLLHIIADGYFWDYVHLCTDPLKIKGKLLPNDRPCIIDEQCIKANIGEICLKSKGTCHPGKDCLRVFKIWYGGLAYYGGFFFALIVGIWYVKKKNLHLWKIADLSGYGIPLGLFFGRLGCFFSGCCFGKVCKNFLCIKFPKYSPSWEKHLEDGLINKKAPFSLPVYPTQLMEAIGCLFIFLFLYFFLRNRKKFDGQIFFTSLILYAVLRFLLEYLRDDPRGGILIFSTSQIFAIPIFAVSIYFYFKFNQNLPSKLMEGLKKR